MWDEEARWGLLMTIWVAVAAGPTLFANIASLRSGNDSDWYIKWVGGPWTFGFLGLMALWSARFEFAAGVAYSFAFLIVYTLWALYLKRSPARSQAVATDAQGDVNKGNYRFSGPQRLILSGAALAMSLMLFNQIDRYGLDETPWIGGVSVITLLLFAAFMKRAGN